MAEAAAASQPAPATPNTVGLPTLTPDDGGTPYMSVYRMAMRITKTLAEGGKITEYSCWDLGMGGIPASSARPLHKDVALYMLRRGWQPRPEHFTPEAFRTFGIDTRRFHDAGKTLNQTIEGLKPVAALLKSAKEEITKHARDWLALQLCTLRAATRRHQSYIEDIAERARDYAADEIIDMLAAHGGLPPRGKVLDVLQRQAGFAADRGRGGLFAVRRLVWPELAKQSQTQRDAGQQGHLNAMISELNKLNKALMQLAPG